MALTVHRRNNFNKFSKVWLRSYLIFMNKLLKIIDLFKKLVYIYFIYLKRYVQRQCCTKIKEDFL